MDIRWRAKDEINKNKINIGNIRNFNWFFIFNVDTE